jgi:hypothetical protein
MLQIKYGPEIEDTRRFLEILSEHKKVTFITTSSRSPYVEKFGESPKSSQLARNLAENLERRGVKVNIIDATKLEIKNCLGCVSVITVEQKNQILKTRKRILMVSLDAGQATISRTMNFGRYLNLSMKVRLLFSLVPKDGGA